MLMFSFYLTDWSGNSVIKLSHAMSHKGIQNLKGVAQSPVKTLKAECTPQVFMPNAIFVCDFVSWPPS